MARTSRLWTVILAAVLTMLTQAGRGQSAIHWSTCKMADGLVGPAVHRISLTASGKVIATSRNALLANELDGFSVDNFPAPTNYTGWIQESPGGQRWALVQDALAELKDGVWHLHPVPEIAAVFHTNGIKMAEEADSVPFFATRQGCVLFLLPGALMEFSSENPDVPRTEVLLAAESMRIGMLTDMTVARDGSLWVTGERGMVRAPGPVRNLGTNSAWQEYLLPESSGVAQLNRPESDDDGGVVALAESANDHGKRVVMFDGRNWAMLPVGAGKFLRAWRGPDGDIWAATAESIFEWSAARTNWVENLEISPGRIFDVAVEPGGDFWLATADGLFRGASQLWGTSRNSLNIEAPVEDMTLDADGRPSFIAAGKLHFWHGGAERELALPPAVNEVESTSDLFALKNGRLFFNVGNKSYLCDTVNGSFASLAGRDGMATAKPMGMLSDGDLCLYQAGGAGRWVGFDGSGFHSLTDMPHAGNDRFNVLYADPNGDLWVGGDRAVLWHHDGGWQRFGSDDHTTPENVVGFVDGSDGKVWCATRTEVWTFDGKAWLLMPGEFNHVNALIRSRNGTIWMASNGGLFCYRSGVWMANGVEEGLPNGPVYGIAESQSGQLWAATALGLRLFYQGADPDPPRTQVRRLTGGDRSLSEGDVLEVLFDGRDKWKYGTRLLYSYQLDQQAWSPFREAVTYSFPHLAAGRHYFQVRAMDDNGNVEPVPAMLNFTVTIPWYRDARWWVIFLPGAAAAVFFAGVAWNRHRRLVRSYAVVEQKVAERTRELEMATRELMHSQKMNALGTLAAGIAHDFNNILSIIKGSAQIIEDNMDQPAKIRTRLDRINTVVQQGAEIVNAMLGFSRGSDSATSRCDINQVVAETLKLLGDRFVREVEIKFERAEDLPDVETSKAFIQQILLNIIFNAAEAMTGRRKIHLMTQWMEKLPPGIVLPPETAPAYILISVQDWGGGMTQEIKARIFEPFFTTKAMSSRRGTGLGLSMVYELAKKMGAGLAVQSVVNKGSIFTLVLPLRKEHAAGDAGKTLKKDLKS